MRERRRGSRRATCSGIRAAAGERVALELAVGWRRRPRRVTALAQRARGRRRARGPSRCASRYSASTRAGEAADQRGGALALGAQQQHLAGVRVRRPGLGVQVVAVVPDRHQAEVVDRREGGGAGADDDPPRAARDGEEVAVARAPGPASAVSATWWPSPSTAVRARVDAGRRPCASGTQSSAPRPAGVRRGSGVGEQRAASRCRAAPTRPPAGTPPPASAAQEGARRGRGRRQASRGRVGVDAGRRRRRASGSFSVVACRGGTASRSTSARVPA